VARDKPIVAVKSGRSLTGARAAGSHTGALIAASEVTVDALFRHSGVIRTDTLREMFDVASLLVSQPAPAGRRVAIITNAGGPAILCADACEAEGLEIPPLADATLQALGAVLPAEAASANPVDLIAGATPELYRLAAGIVGNDPRVDALIVILVPTLSAPAEATLQAVAEAARRFATPTPVLAVLMRSAPPPALPGEPRLPVYAHPEDAARALAKVARYGEWRARPAADPGRIEGVDREEALSIVTGAVSRGVDWLSPEETVRLLRCYGLTPVEGRIAATPAEAAEAASELAAAVALKAIAPGLPHKTEAGAVRIGLPPERVREEASAMEARLRSTGTPPAGYLVQRMAPAGVEMIVGVVHDPEFGPVVACGAGGVMVELLKDVSVRLTPLARPDAEEMVRELRTYPLLTGYRGAPACDVEALIDAVVRVGALVDDLPQVAELDLNPIIVHPAGATVVDARIRVTPPRPSPLLGQR
jgi:acyl-CoA synthetase (NDP forming)